MAYLCGLPLWDTLCSVSLWHILCGVSVEIHQEFALGWEQEARARDEQLQRIRFEAARDIKNAETQAKEELESRKMELAKVVAFSISFLLGFAALGVGGSGGDPCV